LLSKLKGEARHRFAAVQPILLAQALASSHTHESDVEALIASVLLSTEYEIMRGAGHQNIGSCLGNAGPRADASAGIQMDIMRQLFASPRAGFSFRLLSPALQVSSIGALT
jgi:hypothetical protein